MEAIKKLKIAAFQFPASGDIESNLAAIRRGIEQAAAQDVRLLLTQECALCGYPPVEVPSVRAIDPSCQSTAAQEIAKLAAQHELYVALGLLTFEGSTTYNSIRMIDPRGTELPPYHKRALWGWDEDNFRPGAGGGMYEIDGLKVGVRICFEVRFPEYFRELFAAQADLALVAFSDVGQEEQKSKIDVIRSHLVSRATENVMYVLSANSTSQYQLAPTYLVDPDGDLLAAAPLNEEYLLTREIEIAEPGFSRQGRLTYSRALTSAPREK